MNSRIKTTTRNRLRLCKGWPYSNNRAKSCRFTQLFFYYYYFFLLFTADLYTKSLGKRKITLASSKYVEFYSHRTDSWRLISLSLLGIHDTYSWSHWHCTKFCGIGYLWWSIFLPFSTSVIQNIQKGRGGSDRIYQSR